MTETINQRCARLCKEWETAVAEVRAGKLNPKVAGEAYDRYAAAMAERSDAASVDVSTTQTTPAPSAAEMATRRQAASADLWRRVVGRVNQQRGLDNQPDSSPAASGVGTRRRHLRPRQT